jgi:hypothetical protein
MTRARAYWSHNSVPFHSAKFGIGDPQRTVCGVIGVAGDGAFVAIQVQVGQAELDGLVADGYLLPGNREDSYTIGLAINGLMFDWLNGTL